MEQEFRQFEEESVLGGKARIAEDMLTRIGDHCEETEDLIDSLAALSD